MTEQPIGVMTVNSSSSPPRETVVQIITNDETSYDNDHVKVDEYCAPKKKKRSTNILKVALKLLRQRSRKPNVTNVPAAIDVGSKGMWNRLVGAMRPLHLQSDESTTIPSLPTSTDPHPPPPLFPSSPSVDNFEDVNSSSSSSVDGMSRYASVDNLQALDQNDEEEEERNNDKFYANMDGEDEMIDAKAEMFIAQFYEQIKLQRSESDVRYNEMIKRSIG
ncbi:hypothetical protein IC582_017466 [Cucumis melo]|uniref:Uncharacterized protein LOC103494745 n=1 Tax=Cucumis melo TaxID=3656 RepID=A0A1S4DZU7_CUCME|nr:uncharacterized protein LOC103494745 [Cucumis melo]